ncbi:sialidase-3-like isoform X1 [Chiloscyllium plagiosum]|uniref:sialidase-3-like isoform X1 n=2 Tax=Chiloscyllium plagiosum TaxID=36176 RepID=UPI001CB813DF|nr:sialidase-3-like isoform X1 [Chiloscyllium plagiosum]
MQKIFFFCVVCCRSVIMPADQHPSRITLFKREKDTVYRIPSLLYLKEHNIFLAFAEERTSFHDVDAKRLVMRRGSFIRGTVKWKDMIPLKMAMLPGYRTMNPCPVYERKFGVIYLFFTCIKDGVTEQQQIWWGKNVARLCYVLSRDAGASWTQLTDLTDTVLDSRLCQWATFAVGPGHGVQTQQGRLIIPAYAYIISRRCCLIPPKFFTRPHSFYFYSDDSGDNWKLAEPITECPAVECELAEITITDSYHLLYCNARTQRRHRMEALSLDPDHFEIVRLAQGLPESKDGCQGSVVSFHHSNPVTVSSSKSKPGQTGTVVEMSWLLYTHPTGEPCCFYHKRNRTNLGVYINLMPLKPKQWYGPWIIQAGPSGYSDLVYLDGMGIFACLYECGISKSWEQIAFCLFTIDEVMENIF